MNAEPRPSPVPQKYPAVHVRRIWSIINIDFHINLWSDKDVTRCGKLSQNALDCEWNQWESWSVAADSLAQTRMTRQRIQEARVF